MGRNLKYIKLFIKLRKTHFLYSASELQANYLAGAILMSYLALKEYCKINKLKNKNRCSKCQYKDLAKSLLLITIVIFIFVIINRKSAIELWIKHYLSIYKRIYLI